MHYRILYVIGVPLLISILFLFSVDAKVGFALTFLSLLGAIIFLDRGWSLLRDTSSAVHKPYSYSRVQLAWWTCIIASSIIGCLLLDRSKLPDVDEKILLLIGISGVTATAAVAIDTSDKANPGIRAGRHQNADSDNFILDILSDKNGVSIARLQTVLFNITFGIWFLSAMVENISNTNSSLPSIESANTLLLLGISSATYASVKTMENK